MKKDTLVKFDDMDLEVLSSEKELSSVNGGFIPVALLKKAIDLITISINNNCSKCNDNCDCTTITINTNK